LLGVPADEEAPELPDDLARRLLRTEEYERAHRDQWGNWEFGFGESFRTGRLLEPDLDRWAAERRRELAARTQLEPLWPEGRPFAMCLTHDVDLVSRRSTPRQVVRSLQTSVADRPRTRRGRVVRAARPAVRLARAAYNGISSSPAAETLELCVELERERGVTGSYFFTVWPGADASRFDCTYDFADLCRFRGERVRIADVVRTLHDEGFDIGLHGSYNSALVPGLLAREKQALERATGLEVSTTRQHFVHWDVRTTPRLQEAAGFSADSSLGFNRNLGFRAGTSLPFRWFDLEPGERLRLVELPLLVHDGALLRADALELDLDLARETTRGLVDSVAEVGGVATFVFHPNNLERPEFLELYRWSIDYGLERGAWFASVRDIDEWWRLRESRLLG
jgi:hypothetical protein